VRAQLVGVELAGVDQQIGLVAHGRQQAAFVGDRLLHTPGGQRVPAAGALIAPQEHLVTRIEEEDPDPVPVAPQRLQDAGDLPEVPAPTDDQRHPLYLRPGQVDHFGHLLDQDGRQVVDHEPAQVLERIGGGGASRPRHPRHHQELAHCFLMDGERTPS
jgi:hypothetical protein